MSDECTHMVTDNRIGPNFGRGLVHRECSIERAALRADLAAARERDQRMSVALEDRQRYIHAELHVDAGGAPIGYWRDCKRPTCSDTVEALAVAAAAPSAVAREPRGEGV